MLNDMEEKAMKLQPSHAPAMDVVAARTPAAPASVAVAPEPPAEQTGNEERPAAAHKDPKDHPKKPAPAKSKGGDNGVGMAIFATMIIVLGLASMATYAYIQTQK